MTLPRTITSLPAKWRKDAASWREAANDQDRTLAPHEREQMRTEATVRDNLAEELARAIREAQ